MKNKPSKKSTKKQQSKDKKAEDTGLLKAILELGGSKQDYELLADVEDDDSPASSSSDTVQMPNSDELQKFIQSLGLPSELPLSEDDEDQVDMEDESEEAPLLVEDASEEEVVNMSEVSEEDVEDDESDAATDSKEDSPTSKSSPEPKSQTPAVVSPVETAKTKAASAKLLFQPTPRWYDLTLPALTQETLRPLLGSQPPLVLSKQIIERLRAAADTLLQAETEAYEGYLTARSKSEYQWFKTVVKSGTLSDRVSALSLAVAESPVHVLPHLDSLVAMASKKNRREAMMAVDTLCDLVCGNSSTGGLVPDHRKLKFFAEQPALVWVAGVPGLDTMISGRVDGGKGAKKENKRQVVLDLVQKHLMMWAVEDKIKACMFNIIVALDQLSHDPVQHIKSKVLKHAWSMLAQKKEQERTLLTFIVNKLGDQDRKLASKAAYLMQQLLVKHPLMKMVVVKEVEQLIRRKGVSERTQYYACVFLNQIVLSKDKPDVLVARYLVFVYFSLFEELVQRISTADGHDKEKKKQETKVDHDAGVEAKMMSAILTGINRAFPFASHLLLDDASTTDKETTSAPNLSVANLEELYEKHLNMLFRLTHLQSVSFTTSTQALQLVFHVLWKPAGKDVDDSTAVFSPKLASRFYRALYAVLFDVRLVQSTKHFALFFNLMFKALKADNDEERVLAFIKRFAQVCLTSFSQTTAGCAGLIIVSEVIMAKRLEHASVKLDRALQQSVEALRAKFGISGGSGTGLSDDEEEHFVDVDEEDETKVAKKGATETQDKVKKDSTNEEYDPIHQRSPEHCHASATSLWELVALSNHYHPTLSLFARTLLNTDTQANTINYPSDPLQDFTLIRFLDRFVYKNPKKQQDEIRRGDSVMQRKAYTSSILRTQVPLDRRMDQPVNSSAWRQRGNKVPADEQFYVSFFESRQVKPKEDESEHEDVSDGEAMDAIMASVPGAGGSEDEDDSELERLMDEDMAEMAENESDESEVGELNDDEFDELDDESESELGEEEDLKESDDEASDVDVDFDEDDALWEEDSGSELDVGLVSDDMSDASDVESAKIKQDRKARKQAVRKRLQPSTTKKGFDVNAVVPKDQAEKSGGVFASMSDYAHLLTDPDHNDAVWLNRPEAMQEGKLKSKRHAGKRKAPASSAAARGPKRRK